MRNILKSKSMLMLLILVCIGSMNYAFAQTNKTVTGRVMDAKGELLVGVYVQEDGNTTHGTMTDHNGTYTIELKGKPNGDYLLKFSMVGFKDELKAVGKNGILDVTMQEDIDLLDEVVVVGYGTQKKASIVGSITNIEPAKLTSGVTRSLSNNLAGMVSGVIAVQRSGNPWHSNSDFWIRGISSFAGSTNPLVLVDGIERSLHDLDPEEIASFSVLKDAAASAVYGVRGANGVIMIETKRGVIGKPEVNVRVEHALTAPTQIPEYIGSVKYLELINEMYTSQGRDPFVSEATLLNYKNQTDPELYPDVDWWDLISKDMANSTKANVSVLGGSDILRYSIVAGYYNEQGIIENDPEQEWDSSLKVNRFTVRSNVDINITPTTLLRANIGAYLQTMNAPPENTNTKIFYQAMRIPPYIHPAKYADGTIPRVVYKQNPWAFTTQRGYSNTNHMQVESLVSLEQDLKFITKGLKIKASFSFDKFTSNSVTRSKNPDYYSPATSRDEDGNLVTSIQEYGQQYLGYSKSAGYGDQSTYFETVLSYNRVFGEKHNVGGMFMYNQKNYDDGSALPYRYQGIAGRVSYNYDSRYIAEFNFGYNGSENFAPGKRYGFFPAVALGWLISEEEFMEPVSNVISNLKIRASRGKAGNSEIGANRRFAYLSTIDTSGSYYWGVDKNVYREGLTEGEIGVDNLTWETVVKNNVGFDLGLFNGSINLTVDFFKERRSDIFMQRKNVPASAGFNKTVWANYGKVDNQGIDLSLNINHQFNQNWSISAMGNFTYAHNTIIEIDEPEARKNSTRSETGKPVGQLFGLEAIGLFTQDDFNPDGTLKEGIPVQNFSDASNLRPGDIKYKDQNNDGEITAEDRTAIGGTVTPEIVYGFGATINYKFLDFGFFFQGVGNTYRILGGETWLPASSLGAGNIFSNIDDRWTEDNPGQNVFWPRMSDKTIANNEQASTWWLRDMSFLRLKNVEIGFNLPRRLCDKIHVKNLRLYVRGSNLLTFSEFKLWDPELGTNNGLMYPMMKSVSFGLNINFKN